MSFEDDKKIPKKPMLSSIKKKKSEQKPKKRSQWNKNNHSVIESHVQATHMDYTPSIPQEPMRRDSEKPKTGISDARRQMRKDIKKNNQRKSEFEVVFVGLNNDGYDPSYIEPKYNQEVNQNPQTQDNFYTPSLDQLLNNTPNYPQKQQPQVDTSIEQIINNQQTKRVKKEWNRQAKPEVMPVRDLSQERREWTNPESIPEPEEDFKVEYADEPPSNDLVPELRENKSQPSDNSPYEYNSQMQFTSQLDKDHHQFERLLNDMKLNLFSNLIEEDSIDTSTDDTTEATTPISNLKRCEPKVLPEITKEEEEDREDIDIVDPTQDTQETEEELDQIKSLTFGGGILDKMQIDEGAFVGEKIDEDLTKYNNIERIKDYLENEIGRDVYEKAHPILKEFGDDILYENNIPDVIEKLGGIMWEEDVVKYLHFFATLVFFESEQERLKLKKIEEDEKEEKGKFEKESSKKISNQRTKPDFAIQSFKDAPKESEEEENIFKKYANQNPSFDKTANFGF